MGKAKEAAEARVFQRRCFSLTVSQEGKVRNCEERVLAKASPAASQQQPDPAEQARGAPRGPSSPGSSSALPGVTPWTSHLTALGHLSSVKRRLVRIIMKTLTL